MWLRRVHWRLLCPERKALQFLGNPADAYPYRCHYAALAPKSFSPAGSRAYGKWVHAGFYATRYRRHRRCVLLHNVSCQYIRRQRKSLACPSQVTIVNYVIPGTCFMPCLRKLPDQFALGLHRGRSARQFKRASRSIPIATTLPAIAAAALCLTVFCNAAPAKKLPDEHPTRFDVQILSRGPRLHSSLGNMEVFLALAGRRHASLHLIQLSITCPNTSQR